MNEKKEKEVPLFRTWNQWYLFVLGFLVILIILFYLITKHFS